MKDDGARAGALLKAGIEAGAVAPGAIWIAITADADGDVEMACIAEKEVPPHLMRLILSKAMIQADERRVELRERIVVASDT